MWVAPATCCRGAIAQEEQRRRLGHAKSGPFGVASIKREKSIELEKSMKRENGGNEKAGREMCVARGCAISVRPAFAYRMMGLGGKCTGPFSAAKAAIE